MTEAPATEAFDRELASNAASISANPAQLGLIELKTSTEMLTIIESGDISDNLNIQTC